MIEEFHGFYQPADRDLATLWQDGLIVLDANVLLNLYRYPQEAREEMLAVLENFSDRIWVPFQAFLEYQRNRLAVVAEQKAKFNDVVTIVADARKGLEQKLAQLNLPTRHALIDPAPLLAGVGAAVDQFIARLEVLESEQTDVHQPDKLRERLDALLYGKVGERPSQQALDSLKTESVKRREFGIPPGNADEAKEGGRLSRYSYGGLHFEAALGDLYVWKQIIEHAAKEGITAVMLITDDLKYDWWNIIDSGGRKRLGPRPELIEEIRREGNVSIFWMYRASQFVKHARERANVAVSDNSIEQINATARIVSQNTSSDWPQRRQNAHAAVFKWVANSSFGDTIETPSDECDFIVRDYTDKEYAYDIIVPQGGLSDTIDLIRRRVAKAFSLLNTGLYEAFTVIIATKGRRGSHAIVERMRDEKLQFPDEVEIVIGFIASDDGRPAEFVEVSRVAVLRI